MTYGNLGNSVLSSIHLLSTYAFQHVGHVERLHGLLELAGHVDVSLGGHVALVPHQFLQCIGSQLGRIHRGEGPPQIVESVQVAGVGMLVVAVAR